MQTQMLEAINMPMEISGMDTISKCEGCACTFCKKGPLGSNQCKVKPPCGGDGNCKKAIQFSTCPDFDPKY